MTGLAQDRTAEHRRGYELTVVLLLGLAFGFAYFDRMAMTFLAPYVVKDLGLTNTQVGALGSGLSLTWALGAFLIGVWSDAVGRRKPFLLAFMVIFSFCSVLSGLAAGFGTLLASRVVMGAVEGPFLPICLAIIAAASVERRRGLNVGIVQNFFGSLIGTAIAPIVLVWIADHYGWRSAFYLSAVPGLVLGLAANGGTSAVSAATGLTMPYPYWSSRPGGPLSVAVAVNRCTTSVADIVGYLDRTNAATPATIAVASLVPFALLY